MCAPEPGAAFRWAAAGLLAIALVWLAGSIPPARLAAADKPATLILSIVGTSDLHGAALPTPSLGGLPLLAGYVNNLRATRAADGGSVLLIDSGDTFLGTVESNLSEGAFVVDAYNAMGYAAEAVGNHDFDFGSVDSPAARQLPGDLRGALKARAAQARFPFLAANLIDDATGRLVDWPNVRPSAIVKADGVTIGIVGVMTIDALRSTLAANVQGLHVVPPGPAIEAEASRLRAAGAEVLIVAAHVGGRCDRFGDPDDLTSCDDDSEIFQIARSLPPGLVDVIAAGHTHSGLAHRINGIAIMEPFSRGQAFSRIDVAFDRKTRKVVGMRLFAPQHLCRDQRSATLDCAPANESRPPALYEGRPVEPDRVIEDAMARALGRVRQLQATALGRTLDAPILRGSDRGSPLGAVFADALRGAVPDADIAVVNTATRGLRTDLPSGPLTFGRLFEVFPFDNRVARMTMSGAALKNWVANEIRQGRLSGLGISGAKVWIDCLADGTHVDLRREDGRTIEDSDQLAVVTIASPTLSGNVAMAASLGSIGRTEQAPIVREVVEEWVRQPAHLLPGQHGASRDRIELTNGQAAGCVAPRSRD
jgi:2',3'-cyclic-nucleotide 2'-phosphodiesterase (5'-nucleotidase family)